MVAGAEMNRIGGPVEILAAKPVEWQRRRLQGGVQRGEGGGGVSL
jgi:hypothetical protein